MLIIENTQYISQTNNQNAWHENIVIPYINELIIVMI